jgi:hypothetical protein
MIRIDDRVITENAVYYAAGGFALWKGGRWERFISGLLLVQNTISAVMQDVRHLEDPRYVSLTLDVVVLAGLLYVAFKSDLRWTLVGSALQILIVLTFLTRIIDPSINSWAYVTADIALSFGLMGAVVYGAVQHQRRPKAAA